MATLNYNSENSRVVEQYFKLISRLRNRDEAAVEKLLELWHPEGVFEFAGSPPVVGIYKGITAIQTLYKNRLNSSGMNLKLDFGKENLREISLGIVDTQATHLREKENQVIVGWRTIIATEDKKGFDIAGSHLFNFEEGKIKNLRVNISPKPDKSLDKNITEADFSIQDVGRLSLAAWAVV